MVYLARRSLDMRYALPGLSALPASPLTLLDATSPEIDPRVGLTIVPWAGPCLAWIQEGKGEESSDLEEESIMQHADLSSKTHQVLDMERIMTTISTLQRELESALADVGLGVYGVWLTAHWEFYTARGKYS